MKTEVLLAAEPSTAATAPALHLLQPISFWGGVSPEDGRLLEPFSSAYGQSVAGKMLFIRQLRGSSSASSVLLELIMRGRAPAAIILTEPDAILALGILVAQEMGWPAPPLLQLEASQQSLIADAANVTIDNLGGLHVAG